MDQRVVIIGGGFGGLEAAFSLKELLKPSCTITLVDRSAFHFFTPSIHEIVSGKIGAESIQIPLAAVLGSAGIRFIQDEVLSIITREKKEVVCRNRTLNYDYLVLSTGAESNFFNVPGAEEFSRRFRTAENAERIRSEVVRVLDDPFASCRMVLAGGGTEGVEVAGELLDLVGKEDREDDLKSGRISIEIIEGKGRLLMGFPDEARDRVEYCLGARGVNIITGRSIVEVRKDTVILDSAERKDVSILIWTGGIQPSQLIKNIPLQKDPQGWLKVTSRLHSPDDERIFGVGDAVSIYDQERPLSLQRLAHHAQDQARVAALNISYHIRRRGLIAYSPKTKPQLISLGKDMGILTLGERVFSGPWVVGLKKAVERKHLMSYLTRPVSAAIRARIPGAGLIRRLRTYFPA